MALGVLPGVTLQHGPAHVVHRHHVVGRGQERLQQIVFRFKLLSVSDPYSLNPDKNLNPDPEDP